MQVKVFESPDMATGLKMVKDALGPDALILSTKTVHSGKLGLLGKKHFEITAALDSEWPQTEHKETLKKQDTGTYDRSLRLQQESPPPPALVASPVKEDENVKLQSEVDELKKMMKSLGQEMTRITTRQNVPTLSRTTKEDETLIPLKQRILDLGINSNTTETITGFAKETLTLDELLDPLAQQKYLQHTFAELLPEWSTPFQKDETGQQQRIALVGPTGVGKTTTLAKIGARYLSNCSSSIGFITIDTYRIAAVEQLKVYGDIMNVPVEVVLSPEQFERALLKLRDKDLILIDTAGRSPKDKLCIDELTTYFRPDLSVEKHLVLSATTRENELFESVDRFSSLGLDRTLITKIDECTTLGILLDLQIHNRLPFSFVTNGQRVPEDILEADTTTIINLIMSPGEGSLYE